MSLNLKVTVDPPHAVLAYDKKKLRAVMRAAGGEVAQVARKLLRSAVGDGRVYRGSGGSRYRPYKRGVYTASAPGQVPVSVSGTLMRSIKATPSKSGYSSRVSSEFYNLFLEHGAKGGGRGKGSRNVAAAGDKRGRRSKPTTARVLEPRPSLSRALESRESSIADRIRASILDDVKFVRQRA